ncbi:ABC transporter ATP-binding protein/permease [Kineosporia rhizophila]|uniref:ABC transporter ATP-binding protein n=1 Tax=Kineosporia TaxID=49184 RepID=UPI001E32B01A|nr:MULTISPECIES: ABC transporter ATP-binding protein [Kineosporia]MCE0538244.1 ABC transporter ATP-binding protein/permease [Kineosporia rhizophila]GLY15083.1 multidrug ABC transporter permease [Kineosporia sp. NBRC 101677]
MPEPLPVAPGRVVAAHLWGVLAGRRLRLAGILALIVAEAATGLVFPLVVGRLVDTVGDWAGRGVPAAFWWQVSLLAASAVATAALSLVAAMALARVAETVIAELREQYVSAALALPRATVEEAGVGDVVTRASDDVGQVSESLPDVVPQVCLSVFTLALAGAGLTALNAWYLAGFVLTIPFYVVAVRWYLRLAPGVYLAERTAQSDRGEEVLGTLTQVPTVTAHRLQRRQLARIENGSWQVVRWAMRTRIVQNRLFGRLNVTEAIGLLAVLGIGIWLAARGESTTGQVTAATLLFLRAAAPIESLLFVIDELQSGVAALGRIIGVIRTHTPAAEERHTADGPGPVVALQDVSFAYRPGRPVLEGVRADIEAGKVLAVVGSTGSGKSTLASLVAGVHQPGAGSITHRLPNEQVVTVTQETHVFSGTLRDNLTLAVPGADDEQVLAALEKVGAGPVLAMLPEGLDTEVGDGGHDLSAAHAQHLALARLVLADPALVILDEATAEADSAEGDRLDRAASAVVEGRAALVIAHRLSQARQADRILVLEAGQLVESGAHDELVAAGGRYAKLWSAWENGRAAAPSAPPP